MQKIALYNGSRMSLLLLEEKLASVNGLYVWQCSCGSKFMTVYYASFHCEKQHKGEKFMDTMDLKKDFSTDTKQWNAFYTSVSNVIFKTITSDVTVPSDPQPEKADISTNTEQVQTMSIEMNTDELQLANKVDRSSNTELAQTTSMETNTEALPSPWSILQKTTSTQTPILIDPRNVNHLKVEGMEVEELKIRKREIIDLSEEDVVEIKRKKSIHKASEHRTDIRRQSISSKNKEKTIDESVKNDRKRVVRNESERGSSSTRPAQLRKSLESERYPKKMKEKRDKRESRQFNDANSPELAATSSVPRDRRNNVNIEYEKRIADQLRRISQQNGIFFNIDGQQTSSSQELNMAVPWTANLGQPSTRHIAQVEPILIIIPEIQFPIPDPASYPYPNFCYVHDRSRLVNPDETPTRFLWRERANFYYEVMQLNLDPFVARDLWMAKHAPNNRANCR